MEQKLNKAADEWYAGYASGTHVGEMAKPYLLAAFKAGAECLRKIQAENRAKLFAANFGNCEQPSFIPFPKSQLKELQECDWQKYRMEVAKSIHRMLASERIDNLNADVIREIAATAVIATDALIEELKKSEE